MKVFDKRTNEQVEFEVADNGYIVTAADGVKKNISQATLNRWYKATDDEGNDTSFPVIARKVTEKTVGGKKAIDPEKAAEKEKAKLDRLAAKQERADAKAKRDLERADAKAKKAEDRAKAKAERDANKPAKKEAIPSPLSVSFVSEDLKKETSKAKTLELVIAVDEYLFVMKDIIHHIYGRHTMACVVKNKDDEILYTSVKSSAKDCVDWLNREGLYNEEEIFAINQAIRMARKSGMHDYTSDVVESPENEAAATETVPPETEVD